MGQILKGIGGVPDALTEWADAERAGDTTRLNTILTEDFMGVGPLGFLLSKRDWLARYERGDLENEELRLEEGTRESTATVQW